MTAICWQNTCKEMEENCMKIMDCTVENVKAFLAGQPQNVVNK